MSTPDWIKINFKNFASVEIELLQNKFVDSWYRAFINNLHLNRWTRDQTLMLNRGRHIMSTHTQHINDAKMIVDKINASIRTVESLTGKKWLGYAYVGMSWETTNYLHRGFTTSMITGFKTPYLSKELRNEIADMKKNVVTHYQLAEFILNHKTFDDFYQLGDNISDEFLNALEKINAYIHMYEVTYLRSSRAEESTSLYTNEQDRPSGGIAFDIDIKTIDGNSHSKPYEEPVQANLSQFAFNGPEYNVYALKKILGKDYLTAYFQFDDPSAWDISNSMIIDGSFEIDYNENYNYLYNTSGFKHWIENYGLQNRNIYNNYQIGKVKSQEFLTDTKNTQPKNIITDNPILAKSENLGSDWDITSIESSHGVIL